RQIALYRDQKNHHADEGGIAGKLKHGVSRSRVGLGGGKSEHEEEGPHCRRCRNHGKTNPWKGHKKICPFYYCICQQCILITLRKSNEKNLREVVQESNKEIGLKTQGKLGTDEVTFPPPFYTKPTGKPRQEKQKTNEDQEIQPGNQDDYGLRWTSLTASRTSIPPPPPPPMSQIDANFQGSGGTTLVEQEESFYPSRAQQAAAFAAAAAAAVAFQQEAAASRVEAPVPVKQGCQADFGGQFMEEAEYGAMSDAWVCSGDIKCVLTSKDVCGVPLEEFSTQTGGGAFWQSSFSAPRDDDPIRTVDRLPLSTYQQPAGSILVPGASTVHGKSSSHELNNVV
uniref:DM domain-containing protein n=1 Tax=Mesocestoides corti TaxID=53468 RepID=A0A5K3FA60_MESCO